MTKFSLKVWERGSHGQDRLAAQTPKNAGKCGNTDLPY